MERSQLADGLPMELLSDRMGGNFSSTPMAVSYSRSDAKMARNRR